MPRVSGYIIKHKCGHTVEQAVSGVLPHDREMAVEKMEKWNCAECRNATRQEKVAQQVANLPSLQGTEKQVKWASDLRIKLIQQAVAYIKSSSAAHPEWDHTKIRADFKLLCSQVSAKFWIDNRASGLKALEMAAK